jgi:two-component system, NarL family, sensor histidine kinase BarA
MWRGISLANKCLLLFGGAVVLIVLTALSVPWVRMYSLIDDGQLEVSRRLVDVWATLDRQAETPPPGSGMDDAEHGGISAQRLDMGEAVSMAATDRSLARALRAFEREPRRGDLQLAAWRGIVQREYRYYRAVRSEPASAEARAAGAAAGAGGGGGSAGGELLGLIVLQRRSFPAAQMLVVNTIYILSAGFVVLGLAVLVFYIITHQIILSPVRALKETAERVRQGDLNIRSEISTGDEFEELADTFNAMLGEIVRTHEQLQAINSALDVKLNEMAEANTALFEAAKLKGEFLANVSHELRTPLNAVIGFAELMREGATAEQEAGDDSSRLSKRIRYLDNIVTASRNLLDMINGLLEMARIEAGKAQLQVDSVNLVSACQGLLGLISPLAERKGLELKLEVASEIPLVETDQKKFQQVIFNFLSNAVKFTPSKDSSGRPGRVTLRVEMLLGRAPSGPEAEDRVRVSVIDTGPGISPEDQLRLFQKFQQLDGGHTREHTGTGLGLAISKELANILQGQIQVVSDVGRGSMFSLIVPMRVDQQRAEEQSLEARFRGALASPRSWRLEATGGEPAEVAERVEP